MPSNARSHYPPACSPIPSATPSTSQRADQKYFEPDEKSPIDHLDITPMFGEWAGYRRLRVGNLRLIFWYDDTEDIVYVDHIGPRGDVYK